jgi:hypothetical protein
MIHTMGAKGTEKDDPPVGPNQKRHEEDHYQREFRELRATCESQNTDSDEGYMPIRVHSAVTIREILSGNMRVLPFSTISLLSP